MQRKPLAALVLALCLLGCSFQALAQEGEAVSVTVDFAQLQSLNPDCKAWLYQPESGFSQPVMQGRTDRYYADRSFEDTSLQARGTVFLRTAASLTDGVLWLFGNSQASGSPLSWIREYAGQTYYEAHPSFLLLTPDGNWRLDVFACLRSLRKPDDFYQPPETGSYDQWLSGLLDSSDITPLDGSIPQRGDRLAMIANDTRGTRTVLCAVLRPEAASAPDAVNLVKAPLDQRPTYSGYVTAGPLETRMLYAQNDPVWEKMRYESGNTSKFRNLGGGGCGPTAVAIAVANLVPVQDLPRLRSYAGNGVGTLFCQCSVNRLYCSRQHAPYLLETPQEYLRYLPVAMANFAAGNNQWHIKSRFGDSFGTNMDFLPYICDIYGLERTPVKKLADALALLEGGRGVVLCCALAGPFTSTSHYVVIAGVDEESVYILDPLRRTQEEYTGDYGGILDVLTPGVVRVSRQDIGQCTLAPTAYLDNPAM